MRVGQAAHIKDHVGIQGHPLLEGKRLKQDGQASACSALQALTELFAQLMHVQRTGVYAKGGGGTDRVQQGFFQFNRFAQRA